MFEENIGLANYLAYTYYQCNSNLTHEDLKDLKQEAQIELWKASKDYKDIGYKFQTYANKRIRRRLEYIIKYKLISKSVTVKDADTMDLNKNLMLEQISHALDMIIVDGKSVKSDLGKYALILKLEGATDTEIANTLGSHPSNVKRAIDITIRRLQEILKIKECC